MRSPAGHECAFSITPSVAVGVTIYPNFIKSIEQKSHLLVLICTSLITRAVSICWTNMKCENEYKCGSAFFFTVTICHSESRVQPGLGCSFYSHDMADVNLNKRERRIPSSILQVPSCQKNVCVSAISYLFGGHREPTSTTSKEKGKLHLTASLNDFLALKEGGRSLWRGDCDYNPSWDGGINP